MDVCLLWVLCVLSGRGLCDELITRPEESYRLWCVVVCDLETSWMRRPRPTGGCRAKNKQICVSAPLHHIYSSACQIRGLQGRHTNMAFTWCQNTKCSEFRNFYDHIHPSFATRSTSSLPFPSLSSVAHNTWHVYFLLHSYSLLASHFAMNNLSTPEGHFASPLAAPLHIRWKRNLVTVWPN
jgi:hypothetical protein